MACPILVVEDDPELREMMATLLTVEGYDPKTAANGREALDHLRGGFTPHIILLDLMMPVMNGWQFRAEQQHDPFDDVLMEYVNPATGGSVRPTVACYLQLLRPGVRTRAHRETSCAVYRAVKGHGATTVDNETFEWGPGDFFVVPPRAAHAHSNAGSEPAVLFSAQDVPILKALGLYRMEPVA